MEMSPEWLKGWLKGRPEGHSGSLSVAPVAPGRQGRGDLIRRSAAAQYVMPFVCAQAGSDRSNIGGRERSRMVWPVRPTLGGALLPAAMMRGGECLG